MAGGVRKKAELSAAEREQILALVKRVGEVRVAEDLGINGQTLMRAMAGLVIRCGTAVQVRVGLAKLAAPAEPARTAEPAAAQEG